MPASLRKSAWRRAPAAVLITACLLAAGCDRGGSEAELVASAQSFFDKRDYAAASIQLKSITLPGVTVSLPARIQPEYWLLPAPLTVSSGR